MSHGDFRISVLLVTYNHELFIKEAMDALFNQEFDGQIELVIADDCSTDRTLDIIKSYENLDERFCFVYLKSSQNLGVTKNYQRGFSSCNGKYISVLEGDDYWILPYKLKKQSDFLDCHFECGMVSSNYYVFYEDQSKFNIRVDEKYGFKHISARDLIFDNIVGNFSTCMYRKSEINLLQEKLFLIDSYDWIVNICIARYKLIGFVFEPMSVYRIHNKGVWSRLSNIKKIKKQLDLICSYDELTDYVFHDEFKYLAGELKKQIEPIPLPEIAIKNKRSNVFRSLVGCVPPVFVLVIKMLTPPVIYVFLKRACN